MFLDHILQMIQYQLCHKLPYIILNNRLDVKQWKVSVVPYPQLSTDNRLILTIYKINNICTAYIFWTGSVGANNATLDEINIPEDFRPNEIVYAPYVPAVVGTIMQSGGTRIRINKDGTLSFITNNQGFIERRVVVAYAH